jgi:hypothetical protein
LLLFFFKLVEQGVPQNELGARKKYLMYVIYSWLYKLESVNCKTWAR